MLPLLAAVASIGVILLKSFLSRIFRQRLHASNEGQRPDRSDEQWTLGQHIKEHGGLLNFSYQITRFLSALALLVLDLMTSEERAIPENTLVEQQGSGLQMGPYSNATFTDTQTLKLSLSGAYVSNPRHNC